MFLMSMAGERPSASPVPMKSTESQSQCMTMAITSTTPKVLRVANTVPSTVISTKTPAM
ncbi:hypothetical protein D3C86_744440 [compost metagenome]